MLGMMNHTQQHMGGAPGVAVPGIACFGRSAASHQSPVLNVIDGLQIADCHECLDGIGQQSCRAEDPQDGKKSAAFQYHPLQYSVLEQWISGRPLSAHPLTLQSPCALELSLHSAPPECLIGFAKTCGGGILLSPHPLMVAMDVFNGEVMITAQCKQQLPHHSRNHSPAVNQLVSRQQAGMGSVAAQQQLDRQQVEESVFQACIQTPAPLGAHLKEQSQIDHE